MRNAPLNSIEQMIFEARACPEPSLELRRQTLAKSVRAYHLRAQRRRVWVAAALVFGLLWTAGSAQRLLAQPGKSLSGLAQLEQDQNDSWLTDDAAFSTDDWQTVEQTLQSRYKRSQRLRAALGPSSLPGS